jgi:quercetin dioxygenase-like cupin family protein
MNDIDIDSLGVSGRTAETDPYHFKENLNRVTIEGNEDYRLVLFFIKQGTVMPLHDHPNMSVYFKLLFGKLDYTMFDKVDEKYKYNRFSDDEHTELLETKKQIRAKKSC